MAAKKKTKKKKAKPPADKKTAPKKKSAKRKAAPKKASKRKKPVRGKREITDSVRFTPKGLGSRAGGQAGDLQGLTNREGANSESVDELLEEGNAFEAEVVKGVEDAGNADEREVRTHEIPEDDVPGEYLDKD